MVDWRSVQWLADMPRVPGRSSVMLAYGDTGIARRAYLEDCW
jgi:hypothetical protein